MYARTKQLRQLADIQMAMNSTPAANLKMIHADLIFGQFKTSLYRPAGKSCSKQLFQSDIIRARQHVRDKIFDLFRIQNIAGNNKAMGRARQRIFTLLTIKFRPLNFPDYRAFLAFLNVKLLPFLLLKFAGVHQQILNFRRRQSFCRKSRKMPFTASLMLFLRSRTKQDLGFINPAGKVGRDFGHIVLSHTLQPVKECTIPAVPLSLHTSGMCAFFGISGVINGSDCIRVGMISGNDPLSPVTKSLLIPVNIRKESLQGSRRCFRQQRDGFSTLTLQRRNLSLNVTLEMPAGLRAIETVIKLFQKCSQFFTNVFNFFCIHADKLGECPPNVVNRQAFLKKLYIARKQT